ncbi:MAG: biotin carboxylase, partial [Bacteroidota bacterium]
AGGGGKGMRIVENEAELQEGMERAISEATSAFGDGSVFIEKYVTQPRHIELQVLADNHGNVIHLFERECSVQRRHQKVVEEAPAVPLNLAPALRAQMGEAATRVALACDYSGAGTVEFLLDGQGNFYFLEMNTRLQVEHPVTELITGVDLVEEQIRVARNEPLRFQQEDLKIKGHAIELRVYAEDPLDNFLPSIGTLSTYQTPSGAGIRVDDGFEQGMEVPIYYDPMIAKLITYGATREEALQRMRIAIDAYKIEGIATTLPFGRFVADHAAFISGNFDTGFVKEHYSPEAIINEQAKEEQVGAAAGAKIILEAMKTLRVPTAEAGEWLQTRRQ